MPCTRLTLISESIGTQTDLAPIKLGTPFVRFLGENKCVVPDCDTANCFQFGLNNMSVKSPRIPVTIEGIKIPMVIDTGAEVSLLSIEVMSKIFPHGLPTVSIADCSHTVNVALGLPYFRLVHFVDLC